MKINIFGKGEIYKQITPLLEICDFSINKALDDITDQDVEKKLLSDRLKVCFCVGYSKLEKRLERFNQMTDMGIEFMNFQAKNAIVSDNTAIDKGTIINQGVIIDNFVTIGKACFLNIGCMISHDSNIGDGCFIAPGANIAGFVNIGSKCFVGSNATIIDHINIGEGAVVAAGSVVIENVPAKVMVAGNPAVVKKNL